MVGGSPTKGSTIVKFSTTSSDCSLFDSTYGAAADSIRNQLSFQYRRATGIEPSIWESRVYENGLVALVPVAGTTEMQKQFDQVNLGEAFCKALGRAAEALAHQDEDSEALKMLDEVSPKAEQLAATT
jgi:hypothetical protein